MHIINILVIYVAFSLLLVLPNRHTPWWSRLSYNNCRYPIMVRSPLSPDLSVVQWETVFTVMTIGSPKIVMLQTGVLGKLQEPPHLLSLGVYRHSHVAK